MFGLTDEQLLAKGIKIIDGIAGGGKSSKIDKFFRDNNLVYARFTSTNRLRRDANDRYNMDVKTIAAGLFENHGLHFYAEEKEPPCENIVIDEILQADPKAIDWCIHHADTTNIIITTDSKQLLSPENEAVMIGAFNNLKSRDDVLYVNVTETLRPRNDDTKHIYDEFYAIADEIKNFTTRDLTSRFNTIQYEEMEYNTTDAYITHDNLTEDFIYRDKEFSNTPYLDLLPKGCLSSKPPTDLTRYPVLSQLQAQSTHTRSYTQVMNVGSPVRFQGSEVNDTQKLYFIVQPNSIITARELYTVLTRMWDINSFVVVICDTPDIFRLKTFNGLPVKTHQYLYLDEKVEHTDLLSNKEMDEVVSKYDTDEIYYDRDEVRGKGGVIRYVRSGISRMDTSKHKSTAGSLARRDASLKYSFMDQVYSVLGEHGLDRIRAIHKLSKHVKDNYELDFCNAHPTMLKFEKMPADGVLLTDGPHNDMLNFYLYEGSGEGYTNNSLVTDDMKEYLEEHNLGPCTYLFSTPYIVGTFPGEWLYAKTHNDKEDKKTVKSTIHYGYYQKPYLKLSLMGDCYVRYDNYIYELLICQIFSQIAYYTALLYDALDGSSVIVDAVNFPCYNDSTVETVKSILPDYIEFRIRKPDGTILYQNYEELLTKKEKEKERKKNWYANLTPEQKAEKNRRERERRAKKKEVSKNEQK